MFATNSSAHKKLEASSTCERRKTKKERRFPLERRKTFSTLSAGVDRRKNKLEKRRNDIDRREIGQQSNTIVKKPNNLELNAKSIDKLVNDQILIAKKITKLLPFKKHVEFSQTENVIADIYTDIKSLMEKEEYLLCLYLETNNEKLSETHINILLSIINTDISKLSNEIMQFVGKYHIAKISQKNIGFVQLDMSTIRNKIIICLHKKKKHLYPIYITPL